MNMLIKNSLKKKTVLFFTAAFFCLAKIYSEPVKLQYTASSSYILVERTNLRRYDNGKYIGLISREVRSYIVPEYSNENETYYDGNFYVLEKTRRNLAPAAKSLNTAIPSTFKIESDGELIMICDNGFPSFRSFPSYNNSYLNPGDTWLSNAERAVDPLNKGTYTKVPMLIEYEFKREDIYREEEIFVVSAKWASRYGGEIMDPDGDKDLVKIAGKHDATIFISKTNGRSLLISDQVDETYFYSDGKQINHKGTISLFTEYPPTYNSKELYKTISKVAEINERSLETLKNADFMNSQQTVVSTKHNILIEKTNAGLQLNIQNLRFLPDSAELLPEENERLLVIYEMLKECPENSFLVEGHTADTGNPAGEKQLSLERAKSIASALIKLGIPEEKIICKGSGSEKPIAGNDTPENMAKNRRVEITILGTCD